MIHELYRIDFYFLNGENFYKVMCVAFLDNTYSIFVQEITRAGDIVKNLASFDIMAEPTSQDAKDFLIKTVFHAQPNSKGKLL